MTEYVLVEAAWDEKPSTAAWLLATADEKGIDRKLVLSRNNGFLVPAELLDVIEAKGEAFTGVAVVPPVTDPVTKAEPDRSAVRAWAKENGYDVADKGRIAADVVDAYKAAVGW